MKPYYYTGTDYTELERSQRYEIDTLIAQLKYYLSDAFLIRHEDHYNKRELDAKTNTYGIPRDVCIDILAGKPEYAKWRHLYSIAASQLPHRKHLLLLKRDPEWTFEKAKETSKRRTVVLSFHLPNHPREKDMLDGAVTFHNLNDSLHRFGPIRYIKFPKDPYHAWRQEVFIEVYNAESADKLVAGLNVGHLHMIILAEDAAKTKQRLTLCWTPDEPGGPRNLVEDCGSLKLVAKTQVDWEADKDAMRAKQRLMSPEEMPSLPEQWFHPTKRSMSAHQNTAESPASNDLAQRSLPSDQLDSSANSDMEEGEYRSEIQPNRSMRQFLITEIGNDVLHPATTTQSVIEGFVPVSWSKLDSSFGNSMEFTVSTVEQAYELKTYGEALFPTKPSEKALSQEFGPVENPLAEAIKRYVANSDAQLIKGYPSSILPASKRIARIGGNQVQFRSLG